MADDDRRLLGVGPDASAAELRARWLALVKDLHPDRHADPSAAARLAEVNAAYDRLRGAAGAPSDPAARTADPAARSAPPAPPPAAPAATFAVDDFRPVVFEAVLLAAVDVGDVTRAEEPVSLDMWVGGGSCHVELVPEAGGSIVSVDCVGVDAGVVAEALARALGAHGFGVTLGG